MSNGMNRVILLGNIGAAPELRYTNGGAPVLSFRLATNETYVDKNRETHERTDWHSIVVWGPRAETLEKLLAKGACVLVEGSLRTSSFEKDGQKRTKAEVHARDVYLTGRRSTDLPTAAPAFVAEPRPEPSGEAPARSAESRPAAGRSGGARPRGAQEAMLDEMPF